MTSYDQLAAIRLGFGLSPRIDPPRDAASVAASVDRAVAPDPDAILLDQVRDWQIQGRDLSRAAREGGDNARKPDRAHRQDMRARFDRSILNRFARAVDDPSGFGERLVWFWADHFTTRGGSVYENLLWAAMVNDAIRPHLTGRFAEMMIAAETHPAMLRFLDQSGSVGPNSVQAMRNPDRARGLNENLAREMIELHSLGVGAPYDQADVEGLARLLTGLSYNPNQPGVFRPNLAEPGAETILGRSYGGEGRPSLDDITAAIGDLARHPATADHIARKMAVHFIADDPPAALVARLSAVFSDTDGDLGAMNLAIAEAPELASAFRAKMRQPFEFLAASLRGLGITGDQVRAMSGAQLRALILQPLEVMGQPWADPPGPDGWPEDAGHWASPQGLAMRITWAMNQPAAMLDRLPDARDFLATALGDTASEALTWAVPRAESQAEGIGLVLASADFNRR